ncbi:MAG: membrane dipeptidase [Trueperaceae bacterium]
MDTTEVRPNKGFHPLLEEDHPYIFIDSCMQAWPDAAYDQAHQHGVTAYGVTAWLPHATVDTALESIMYWHLVARKHPNLLIVSNADDIRNAKRDGRAGLLLAAQDGDFIGNKLHRIEAFYRLGLRMMLPAYNRSNLICDGCLDRTESGLTRFGVRVVDECNRVGLLLDCTHVGRRASLEIIERSSSPVVFSHSNPNAVAQNPRNIDDEQIRACAERGGVIGLAPFGPLVMREGQQEWPTLDDFVDHIDYVVQLTGSSEHIGIGTDMSLGTYPDHSHDPWGEPDYPAIGETYSKLVTGDVRSPMRALRDFNSFSHVPSLIGKLNERGYRDADVRNILGENYLNLFERVWK